VSATAALTLQRQQQQLQVTEPAYEDMADPLTGSATHLGPGQSDVSPMWNQAWSKHKPRQLRVLMLHSLWKARCSAAGSPSHTARAVVGRFVGAVKQQVAMEWQRVSSDIRWGTGLPFDWFRGRDPFF
jgi:hypothetical protein